MNKICEVLDCTNEADFFMVSLERFVCTDCFTNVVKKE